MLDLSIEKGLLRIILFYRKESSEGGLQTSLQVLNPDLPLEADDYELKVSLRSALNRDRQRHFDS